MLVGTHAVPNYEEEPMTMPGRVVMAVLWTLSLIAVAVTVRAQGNRVTPPVLSQDQRPATAEVWEKHPNVNGLVIAGENLGFRVDGYRGTTPVGTIVVRVGGEWVDVESAMKSRTLK
jgi:hypothetical protein